MTAILSKGIPNRWWASMTSSPLLIRVEELIADVAASVVTGQLTTADLISRGDPSRRHRNR